MVHRRRRVLINAFRAQPVLYVCVSAPYTRARIREYTPGGGGGGGGGVSSKVITSAAYVLIIPRRIIS